MSLASKLRSDCAFRLSTLTFNCIFKSFMHIKFICLNHFSMEIRLLGLNQFNVRRVSLGFSIFLFSMLVADFLLVVLWLVECRDWGKLRFQVCCLL